MPGKNIHEDKITYESGAARSTMDVRWDLLCEEFIRDMAVVMKEGADKYGDNNWKAGVPEGVTINHLLEHLFKWQDGDRGELHLAKVAINAMFLDWYEQRGVVGQ
jgi:hypothetical protein